MRQCGNILLIMPMLLQISVRVPTFEAPVSTQREAGNPTHHVHVLLTVTGGPRTEHLELDHVDAGQSYLGRDNRRASEVVSNILLDVDILADGRHAIDRHDHIKTTQRRSA